METFYIYTPVAHGTPKIDKIEVFMSLVPIGKENAIKRSELANKCVEAGIISADTVDKDRAMRNIMRRAKVDYNFYVTNDGDGTGYYRPTPDDAIRLARNNRREKKKALSSLKGGMGNEALYEDYRHERITT